VANLSHQLQTLSGEKLDWEKERLDLERSHRAALTDTTATIELLQIKGSENRAAYDVTTRDCDDLRSRLSSSLERTSELEEELSSQMSENSELRSVQNELLENLREKTSATGATTREIAMLRREKGASVGEIAALESKVATLVVRMEAQKDLLRGDQKAATDALEEQLREAISEAEEHKKTAKTTRDELETMEDELEREREIVIELSGVRKKRKLNFLFFFSFFFFSF
jgi:chromosome segregation ATPase